MTRHKGKLKILIFNVNWLGDVLFSTPAIKLIRKIYPHAFIACIVPPRCKEILEENPNLDEIIVFDERGIHRSIWEKLKFIKLLYRKKFNKAFLFHRSFTRALVLYLARIPERIGYYTKKRFYLLTSAIKSPDTSKMHRADYYLYIVAEHEKYTGEINFKPDFFISQNDKEIVAALLKEEGVGDNDFTVVLNPGGNWTQKRWPKENFSVLSAVLIRDYGAKIILTGAAKDKDLADEIANLSGMPLINLCGKTNLKQLAALMQKVDVVVSNDSGPLHIGSSVGAKIIGIFGPTSILLTGPYKIDNSKTISRDVGCAIPCYKQGCSDIRCMKAVTIDDVLDVIKKITGK
ncbi:MAG TPA: lipopolysaccharide heptosyltransferase II [Candidatus Omnitrophica bacterium]|nr:lipopolysaccharide heptosyltransferase II [Candidatus Omnitrophota bacterium]